MSCTVALCGASAPASAHLRSPKVYYSTFRGGRGQRHRTRFTTAAAAADDDAAAVTDDAAAAAATAYAALLARAMALRAREIKAHLARLSESSKDLFEKEELAKALAAAWRARLAAAVTVPLRQLAGMPGNPRAGYVAGPSTGSLFSTT